MPAYKDAQKGTWYAAFYYQDWKGVKKKKLKRGFPTKKEALAWERTFLLQQAADLTMTFEAFVEIYEKCLAGGDIVVLKHNQEPKYLSYVLATTDARQQKSKGKVKSKVVHSSVPAIREIKVPIPPIEIQCEIVRILDDYTENIVELQNQLTAEITARQKQYEFYRDKLLTFDVLRGGTIDFRWRMLCEIADISTGNSNTNEAVEDGKYPFFVRSQEPLRKNDFEYAIMTAFAKTGLVAVIDEVTGYQADRDRDELQKVLEKYISAELLPWAKRFPDEFYKQMFRLKGWQYKGKAKTPYAGKLTNEYIYSYLPDGVLDELKKTTPKSESGNRKNRFHQHLTEETGLPNLDKQLQQTIALMKASDTWEEFDMLFKKAMGEPVQMSLEDKSSEVVNNSL